MSKTSRLEYSVGEVENKRAVALIWKSYAAVCLFLTLKFFTCSNEAKHGVTLATPRETRE